MAFLRFANATIVRPSVSKTGWKKARTAGAADADLGENLIDRASSIFKGAFDPSKYLLTHATIVCSVDTYAPEGVKTGSVLENGFRVNRRYADYRVTPETDKYINNNCFIPGTPITMADGTVKPIEDVQVGDMVLTHRGRARRVTETFRRDVDGELLEIKVRGSNERLFVTPEHPFFAFQPNTECVACGGRISRKHRTVSHLLGKQYCSKECFYKYKVPNEVLLQNKHGRFVEASGLTLHDFAAVPVIEGEGDVGLTLAQARLVGLFAAEGYYELDSRNGNERVGVCWAFHEDERHTLAKTVCDLMLSEFGVECVIRPHQNDRGIHVTTKTSRKAVDFFSSHVFGEGAADKWLHRDLLTAPLAVQAEILRGWFEGDGSAFDTGTGRDVPGDFRLTGTSASQSLANQMLMLLHRQGIAPRMQHNVSEGRRRLVVDGAVRVVSDPTKECHSWVLSCGAGYIESLVQDTVYADAYEAAAEARGGFQRSPDLRFLNGYCLQMFTGIDPVAYRGPVYNFETEEDHSYIAGGVAVHNCDAWSRDVLLKSFRSFIGGFNFVEHVQVEELSKGRIIDAVARDIGESVYIDILIATDRKHKELVAAIESGKMGTLSMGCFLPGTQVTMADGRRIAIEDVQPGDMVLTHKGRAREVLNKQIRGGKWDMRTVHAVGLASPITATANHPFYVLRPADVRACGCGESLPAYAPSVKKPTTRSLTRRFKRGHDKRILNPNNTYSMDEFKCRKAQVDEIQNPELVKVRADELRVGDFIAFPRVKDGEHTVPVSEGKARLLGYFLAEGCFAKEKGHPVQVTFCFSMDEKDTFVAEVDALLRQEFPNRRNDPWVQERPSSNNCMVHLRDPEVAAWFKEHGGEYSHGKALSADAMNWSQENHKHLIGAWLNGDGHRAKAHGGFLVGTTVSLDLASQMHALMAKCGWFARFEARLGSKSVTVAEAINGGVAVRDEATGKLPAYLLTIGNTQSVELQGYCAKAPTTSKYGTQNNRTFEDWVVSPITAIEESTYDGEVHNMEVAEDHTYVAVGACVSNCTVDGTICTKCGHWAADETEMCFPTGTRILMADGKYVPIEEVVEGDLVITHTGAVQPVLHTMGRHHDGNVTVLNVEGVPQPVRATTGHRFWVMRPETHCQCGCGEPLRRTIEHERGAVQAFQRRFLPGHNSKVGQSSALPFTTAPRELGAKLEFVPAKDIRKGDYLTFPIPQQVTLSPDVTEAKARLIGFFLAEGSFIKRDGALVGVSFDFGAHEHDTLAAEVEGLLNDVWGRDERRTADFDWQTKVAAEGIKPIRRRKTSRPVPSDLTCPSCEAPAEYAYNVRFKPGRDDCYQCKVCGRQWVEGADRAVKAHRNLTGESTCSVRLMWAEAAEWFHRFCGEYAHGKVLAPEVMYWPQEVQKHVLFGWLGGDGTQSRLGITGNTASFDLVSQMHVLAARCGWYSRKQVTFDRRAAILDEVVNGSGLVTVRDSNGWLPSFSLTVAEPAGFGGEVRFSDPENARVTLSGITDGFKRVGNYLLYRVREAWNECFSGLVHNIEVAGDESYVVEGLAVHNCPHVKYQKGQPFYDELGRQHRVAELCGHATLGPNGGVQFIEASWVGTPAFQGAVLRNILEPTAAVAKQAEAILNSLPPQWAPDSNLKAASGHIPPEETFQTRQTGAHNRRAFESALFTNQGEFLAGWDDEEGGGDEAPAEPAAPANPLDDTEKELEQYLIDRVERKVREKMDQDSEEPGPEDETTTNEAVVKEATQRVYSAGLHGLMRTASSDIEFLDSLAALNKAAGIPISVPLYRAVLAAGPVDGYNEMREFAGACRAALGRKPTSVETRTLVRLGKLLSRRSQVRRASIHVPGSRHKETCDE